MALNNNRGNNRRRGRNNNNNRQGGSQRGEQLNRIDSRARGNAPQLLEKYRKLAHDAQLNGDRVTEEYYLQFADHYFRVLADSRARQEEARQQRDQRWQERDGERDDDRSAERDGGRYDDRGRYEDRSDDRYDDRNADHYDSEGDAGYQNAPAKAGNLSSEDETPVDAPAIEAAEDRAPRRGLRPRKREQSGDEGGQAASGGLDPSLLPPAIGVSASDTDEPVRRRRAPRRTNRDEGSETAEVSAS